MPRPLQSPERPLWLRLRHKLEIFGLYGLIALVRALGVDTSSAVSGYLWRKLAPFNRRHARADANLARALPALSPKTRAALLADMWENLGRTMAEGFHLEALLAAPERFEMSADTRAILAQAARQSAVFVSLHQGNWELAAPLLAKHGVPVAGIYQRVQNPRAEAMLAKARAPFYPRGLYAKHRDTPRALLRVLGEGGSVAIMADLRDYGGISVPFFGLPAPSTPFPALLARGRGVPLYAGAILRTRGARFFVQLEEIPVPRTADRQADHAALTAAIQQCFERFIRTHPEQWMWGHRRWG